MMEQNQIGRVQSVDTGNVTLLVSDETVLDSVQVNQIVWIRSTHTNERIVGLVSKILRRAISDKVEKDSEPDSIIENVLKITLMGTWRLKEGTHGPTFKRTLNTVPSIGADAFLLKDDDLTQFMSVVSSDAKNPLRIGKYIVSQESDANLDGNKFFQRHAIIVGGTGSGKSWTVASLLEQASKLKSVNGIVFDLHGEYSPLSKLNNVKCLRIAGPSDNANNPDIIFLPYWLLSYEEMEALMLDRSDQNAPNQARILFDDILRFKKDSLVANGLAQEYSDVTVESPFPYDIAQLLGDLAEKDEELIEGARPGSTKQGPLYGKLTRFIQRLRSKLSDKRLNFMFNDSSSLQTHQCFESLAVKLIGFGQGSGLKIIDFSEVPSDILPLITGLVARLVFSLQQWMPMEKLHPVAIFCDEAHLYITNGSSDSIDIRGTKNFERISKEGRKYGLALVVISQRPSDVNKTVLSQCGNFIAMRLTNPDDQNVIRRLFPDNLGDFAEALPILDIGEAIVVGDACLLPSRVKVTTPTVKPKGETFAFWDKWSKEDAQNGIKEAVHAYRRQQK